MFFQAAFLRKADVLKPKHLLGERTNLNTLPIEKFKAIVLENSEPLTTERYPGYKRGTKSFAGTLLKKRKFPLAEKFLAHCVMSSSSTNCTHFFVQLFMSFLCY